MDYSLPPPPQAPLSMGFSRQKYWSGLSCPPAGDLPNPGIKPTSLKSPALAGGFFTTSATWEAPLPGLEQCKSVGECKVQPFQKAGMPSLLQALALIWVRLWTEHPRAGCCPHLDAFHLPVLSLCAQRTKESYLCVISPSLFLSLPCQTHSS